MRIDRRALIGGALAALAAADAGAARPRPFFAARGARLGIQLYTVAEQAAADLDGTLGRLAAMGYRQVELAGLLGRPPAEWARLLLRHGLVARSAHVPFEGEPVNLTDGIGLVADTYRPLGVETAVLSFPPPVERLRRRPAEPFDEWAARLAAGLEPDDWRRMAARLDAIAGRLRGDGLRFAYHNHNIELAPKEATHGLGLLLDHTDPALVSFEMDAGWVAAGGGDPVALLRRWPGRFRLMHVKDLSAASPVNYGCRMAATEIGRGRLDWARILPAAWNAGVREFLVEQEPPFPRGRLEAAAANARFLRALRV